METCTLSMALVLWSSALYKCPLKFLPDKRRSVDIMNGLGFPEVSESNVKEQSQVHNRYTFEFHSKDSDKLMNELFRCMP